MWFMCSLTFSSDVFFIFRKSWGFLMWIVFSALHCLVFWKLGLLYICVVFWTIGYVVHLSGDLKDHLTVMYECLEFWKIGYVLRHCFAFDSLVKEQTSKKKKKKKKSQNAEWVLLSKGNRTLRIADRVMPGLHDNVWWMHVMLGGNLHSKVYTF